MGKTQSVITDLSKVATRLSECNPKFLRLTTLDGAVVVTFNKPGATWQSRYKEIVKKLPSLPDGIYIFQAQDQLTTGAYCNRIVFGKGEFEPLSELPPLPMVQSRSESPLLSVETAVENVRSTSQALAENEYLKKEIASLKAEKEKLIAECQAEEYLDDEEEEVPNAGLSWIKETIPALLPLADRFFDMEEKKLNFKQNKFLHDNGYEIPGLEKRKQANKLPPIGSKQFGEMVEEIAGLEDSEFNSVMDRLKAEAPAHYSAILPLVWEEEESGTETEEKEEETNE